MLAKKPKQHVDIRTAGDMYDGPVAPGQTAKKPDPKGPMVHISGIELPLTDNHINTSGNAEIKYVLRKKSKGDAYGKPSNKSSYDIEITHIKFGTDGT